MTVYRLIWAVEGSTDIEADSVSEASLKLLSNMGQYVVVDADRSVVLESEEVVE